MSYYQTTMTRVEERLYALWLTQRLLAGIERELRRVGYYAELDEYARPFAAWVVNELRVGERFKQREDLCVDGSSE